MYKKMIVFVCMIITLIAFISCNSISKNEQKIDFPKNENGYPQGNVVFINSEQYILDDIENTTVKSHITHEIDLKLNKKQQEVVEVILPQKNPINFWDIEAREDIDLISYEKINMEIEDKNRLEGSSSVLQKYKFVIPKETNTSVSFKWSNVNEIEKSFNDKKENYLLNIKISN